MANKQPSPGPVNEGYTGVTTFTTAYGVLCAGTAGTQPIHTLGALGDAGDVLTSNGAAAWPSFQPGGGGGGITSVSGTANQIDSTGTPAVTLSLSSTMIMPGTVTMLTANNSGTEGTLTFGATLSAYTIGHPYNFFINNKTSLNAGVSDIANFGVGFGTFGNLQGSGATDNIAIGTEALSVCYNSFGNVALGYNALKANSSSYNVAIGHQALSNLQGNNPATQGFNIALGFQSGISNTGNTSDSYNVYLNSPGAATESNTLRIGETGTAELVAAYIGGIDGVNIAGAAVMVDGSNQLGIVVSSKRYKENIKDMGSYSSPVMKLRPVNFNYKVGKDRSLQGGLIAEEVWRTMPALVINDKEGLPQTVKYHELPVLLLNEIQKLTKRIEALEARL